MRLLFPQNETRGSLIFPGFFNERERRFAEETIAQRPSGNASTERNRSFFFDSDGGKIGACEACLPVRVSLMSSV